MTTVAGRPSTDRSKPESAGAPKAASIAIDGSTYLRPDHIAWQPDGDKYWVKALYDRPDKGERVCLARLEPGASFGMHAHDEVEHIYVLSGSFRDQNRTLRAGDYAYREPGAQHTADTDEGAVLLLVYSRP
jgi:anti-sigma factor ChrR (cupin superfamily)